MIFFNSRFFKKVTKKRPQDFFKNSNLKTISVICQKSEIIKIEIFVYYFKKKPLLIMTSLWITGEKCVKFQMLSSTEQIVTAFLEFFS